MLVRTFGWWPSDRDLSEDRWPCQAVKYTGGDFLVPCTAADCRTWTPQQAVRLLSPLTSAARLRSHRSLRSADLRLQRPTPPIPDQDQQLQSRPAHPLLPGHVGSARRSGAPPCTFRYEAQAPTAPASP